MKQNEILALILQTSFRPFTQDDWQCFMGCQSESPWIGETDESVIVIDRDELGISYTVYFHQEDDGNAPHPEDAITGQLSELFGLEMQHRMFPPVC